MREQLLTGCGRTRLLDRMKTRAVTRSKEMATGASSPPDHGARTSLLDEPTTSSKRSSIDPFANLSEKQTRKLIKLLTRFGKATDWPIISVPHLISAPELGAHPPSGRGGERHPLSPSIECRALDVRNRYGRSG